MHVASVVSVFLLLRVWSRCGADTERVLSCCGQDWNTWDCRWWWQTRWANSQPLLDSDTICLKRKDIDCSRAGNSSSHCDNRQNQTRGQLETAHHLHHEEVSLHPPPPIPEIFFCYRHNIEVSGGLGPTVGVVWRIGLMGYNSRSDVIEQVAAAMADALKHCTAAKL